MISENFYINSFSDTIAIRYLQALKRKFIKDHYIGSINKGGNNH